MLTFRHKVLITGGLVVFTPIQAFLRHVITPLHQKWLRSLSDHPKGSFLPVTVLNSWWHIHNDLTDEARRFLARHTGLHILTPPKPLSEDTLIRFLLRNPNWRDEKDKEKE